MKNFEPLPLPPRLRNAVEALTQDLVASCAENLRCLALFGSAASGADVSASSDLNVLIVLAQQSTREHLAISAAIASIGKRGPTINPMTVSGADFARTAAAFPVKFASIARNYRVVAGTDLLATLVFDDNALRTHCEQSLRNVRMRSVRMFVLHRSDRRRYRAYLTDMASKLRFDLAELMRVTPGPDAREAPALTEDPPPQDDNRWAAIGLHFGIKTDFLEEIDWLRRDSRWLDDDDVERLHTCLFNLLDSVIKRLESDWPGADV